MLIINTLRSHTRTHATAVQTHRGTKPVASLGGSCSKAKSTAPGESLERAGLVFGREIEQVIYYGDIEVGTRRADFIVENKVVVELKASIALEDVHLAQAKNYVVAYDFAKGLLINFGAKSLEYKLIFNPKYNPVDSKIQ